jgi:oligosaccharyltransferase complex subunit alpha (ribophorin I)
MQRLRLFFLKLPRKFQSHVVLDTPDLNPFTSDVEVFPPFYPSSFASSTHTTYLDTTGRPTVVFKYKNLTDKHTGVIYIAYKVPLSAHLKKPTAVGIAFFSVFFVAFLWKRVDLKLEK